MSKVEVQRGEGGRWLPGASANPSGRPTKEYSLTALIKSKAQEDAPRAYQILWSKIEEADVKALNLYFNLLEKHSKEKIQNLLKESDLKDTNSLLQALVRSLGSYQEFTFSQTLSAITTVNNIKMTENVEKETLASKLSDEKITAIMNLIQEDKTDKMEEENKSE